MSMDMGNKNGRVYMGTFTQRQTRTGKDVISGKIGAAAVSMWPARTPGPNGEVRWNMYFEEPFKKEEGDRIPSGTEENEGIGDEIPF